MVNFLNWLSPAEPMDPNDNIRRYISETSLPTLRIYAPGPDRLREKPPPGHKSHKNKLQVRSEEYRVFEQMERLDDSDMREAISEWCSTVPHKPVTQGPNTDEEQPQVYDDGLKFSTPCQPESLFRVRAGVHTPVDSLHRLRTWLEEYPLNTVQHLMHQMYPAQTRNWRFDSEDPTLKFDPDYNGYAERKPGFGFFRWSMDLERLETRLDRKGYTQINEQSVIVAYQPPWILSEADMKEFAASEDFPPYNQLGFFRPLKLKASQRNWAKMYDVCVQKGARYFVLTSYDHWVFGRFSPQYTRCHVTKVFNHDTSGPTIVEHLAYWVATAMGLTNTFPKLVFFEPMLPGPPQVPHRNSTTVTLFPDEPDSESDWDGKSILPGSSAGVQLTTPAVSVASSSMHVCPADRPTYKPERVREWLKEIPVHGQPRNALVRIGPSGRPYPNANTFASPEANVDTRRPDVIMVPQPQRNRPQKQAQKRAPKLNVDRSRIGDVMWYGEP